MGCENRLRVTTPLKNKLKMLGIRSRLACEIVKKTSMYSAIGLSKRSESVYNYCEPKAFPNREGFFVVGKLYIC